MLLSNNYALLEHPHLHIHKPSDIAAWEGTRLIDQLLVPLESYCLLLNIDDSKWCHKSVRARVSARESFPCPRYGLLGVVIR